MRNRGYYLQLKLEPILRCADDTSFNKALQETTERVSGSDHQGEPKRYGQAAHVQNCWNYTFDQNLNSHSLWQILHSCFQKEMNFHDSCIVMEVELNTFLPGLNSELMRRSFIIFVVMQMDLWRPVEPQRPLVGRCSSQYERQRVGLKSDTHNAPGFKLGCLETFCLVFIWFSLRSLAGNEQTKLL